MFDGCISLKKAELVNLKRSKISDYSYMFNNCINLKNIVLTNFDNSQTNNMNYMFNNCSTLPYLDLSAFKGSSFENTMDNMFYGCNNLRSIDFPNIDISKTKFVSKIFSGCENNLQYLSLA